MPKITIFISLTFYISICQIYRYDNRIMSESIVTCPVTTDSSTGGLLLHGPPGGLPSWRISHFSLHLSSVFLSFRIRFVLISKLPANVLHLCVLLPQPQCVAWCVIPLGCVVRSHSEETQKQWGAVPTRKTSSISRTKSQNLNVSRILLQLSSLNPLKPGVKLRMKM